MTERRIVERTYNGMTRYVVQYKVLCFWTDNPSFRAKDYIGERVVE